MDSSASQAFRLMVNRSVTWADWDEELLALELQEIQESDFDLSLTGFDPGEIDKLLGLRPLRSIPLVAELGAGSFAGELPLNAGPIPVGFGVPCTDAGLQ